MTNVATLKVDLQVLVANWQTLSRLHGGEKPDMTAAVVKANAYGLGAVQAVESLQNAGCKHFFVATLSEAIALRQNINIAKEAFKPEIYVFQGVLKGEESEYLHHELHPIINHVAGLKAWLAVQNDAKAKSAIINIDSGMNRLGLSASDLDDETILQMAKSLKADLLMTHYACASDLSHPKNAHQFEVMKRVEKQLPHLTTCYANSAAHFLPRNYHGAISRPGCALYGINPLDNNTACHSSSQMQPVAELSAPILQLRTLHKSEVIGYGATETLPKGAIILTAGIGYADGIHRQASHSLYGFMGEHRLPQIGRITMDMTCYNASNVPQSVLESASSLMIIDKTQQTVNDLASIYNTIGYEVLTSIGERVKREYTTK